MSTIVRQNLVTETTTLKLKVAANDDHHSPEFGNWGFLYQENNTSININNNMENRCYSHLLDRKPSFSAKSLELCTENLGSETGSDTVSDGSSIFSCSPPLSPSSNSSFSGYSTPPSYDHESIVDFGRGWKEASYSARREANNSCRRGRDFPPPLTTMSGFSSLQVRRRAEGGRLIIEAVEMPFRNSYLQAERSDGRLRLCFLTAETAGESEDEEEEGEEENGGEETEAEEQVEGSRAEFELENEEFDGEKDINRDMAAAAAAAAAGIEKFRAPRRCKEGSHGRGGLCCNWKPLWVATS